MLELGGEALEKFGLGGLEDFEHVATGGSFEGAAGTGEEAKAGGGFVVELGHDLELGGGETFDELARVEGFGGGILGHGVGLDGRKGVPLGFV